MKDMYRNHSIKVICAAMLALVMSVPAEAQIIKKEIASKKTLMDESNETFSLKNIRLIQNKLAVQQLAENDARDGRRGQARASAKPELISSDQEFRLPAKTLESIKLEANYIVSSQYINPGHPANGAINNVYGDPTWIVPRENALAILALVQAFEQTGNKKYMNRAQLAADYLVRVQDSDGAWYDQYSYAKPVTLSKSPTQTAEVMMALDKLGYTLERYEAMKKGAKYLMDLQNVKNKQGLDDGLICGGKKADGSYYTWRWTSDNSYGYLALKAASQWAKKAHDFVCSVKFGTAAKKVLNGINQYLHVVDKLDSDYGVWRRVIDENGVAVDPGYHEWINYAPQMLDIPAEGVGSKLVGEWIHKTFQKSDGSVVWDDRYFADRKSPGYSFQAALVWLDLGQKEYAKAAWNWAANSGLWQKKPDANGISGGWIDWTQNGTTAQFWERFIDTSFYAISVLNGGYNFNTRS